MLSYVHWGYVALLLCCIAAAVLSPKRSRKWLLAALAALFLWSWPPTAWLTCRALERWYAPIDVIPANAQAIVVLSAGQARSTLDGALPDPGTYLRSHHAAWLYKRSRPIPVVPSGGPMSSGPPVAVIMQRVIEQEGVPHEFIWPEETSTSTYFNAVNVARILRARGIQTIALVTDAVHTPRAAFCFRKQGFSVIPAPCNFRTLDFATGVARFLPSETSIADNEEALHEAIGLIWYYLSGKL